MGEDPSQDDPCNREGSEHEGESKALFWPPNGDAPVNGLGGYAQPLLHFGRTTDLSDSPLEELRPLRTESGPARRCGDSALPRGVDRFSDPLFDRGHP